MNAVLYDTIKIADAVNVEAISRPESLKAYADFDKAPRRSPSSIRMA